MEPPRSERARPAGPSRNAVARGLGAGAVGVAAIVVLGGVFGISAGLLIIAAAIGWGVARVVSGGSPSMPPDRTRLWIEVAIAVGAVALGQLGLWVFSLAEGGVLAPIEYLSQTFGPLVPIQLIIAGVAAWWTAR